MSPVDCFLPFFGSQVDELSQDTLGGGRWLAHNCFGGLPRGCALYRRHRDVVVDAAMVEAAYRTNLLVVKACERHCHAVTIAHLAQAERHLYGEDYVING